MIMTSIRKEDLSLFYYIKDTVLVDFIEIVEKAELIYVESLSSFANDGNSATNSFVYDIAFTTAPFPNERGRGLVYFDAVSGTNYCAPYDVVSGTNINGDLIEGTPEQSSRVIVYDATLNVIPTTEYMIDYVDCRIITSGTCSPAYIDYTWNYISTVDEWEALPAVTPPVVVVDVKPLDKKGYQLGGGKKVRRAVDLHVFASSSAERNDLSEILYDGLYNKGCPLYNFSLGTVLDSDGTWHDRKHNNNKLTSLFDREVISGPIIGNVMFEEVVVKQIPRYSINNKDSEFLDVLNSYRVKISFYMTYYTSY